MESKFYTKESAQIKVEVQSIKSEKNIRPPLVFTCQKLVIGLVNVLIILIFILALLFDASITNDLGEGSIFIILLLGLYFLSGAYGSLRESEKWTWFYFAFTLPLGILLIVYSLCSAVLLAKAPLPLCVIFTLLILFWITWVGLFALNLHHRKRVNSKSVHGLAEKSTV